MMNYFFYKDYMFNKMIKHSDPIFVSAIMISIIEFSNSLTIFLIINKYILKQTNAVLIVMIFLLIINITLFILNINYFKKNEVRICNKYKGESLLQNIFGYIFYVSYFVGSIVILLVLGGKLEMYL